MGGVKSVQRQLETNWLFSFFSGASNITNNTHCWLFLIVSLCKQIKHQCAYIAKDLKTCVELCLTSEADGHKECAF